MARPPHAYLEHEGPIAFAHRGGAVDAPENTMAAFSEAIGLGFRYLETDVHVTADGVLVAFHDDDLARTCGRPGRISELPWNEVRHARVRGEEPIPLLEDVLASWPEARLNIDCKSDAAAPALAAAIRRTDSLHRVLVASFADTRVRRLRRELGPELCTAVGQRGVAALWSGTLLRSHSHAAQVPVRQGRLEIVTERFVRRAHRAGLQVHVWTVDDPVEMARLLDLGVDGIMTDRPAVLRDVFEHRGLWA
jgi:glycerophosphoryl diester phosphodiesterase